MENVGILKQSLKVVSLPDRNITLKNVCRCLLYVTNAISESISSINIWNIVNQLGKYDTSCGTVVNDLKERHLFSDQVNRNQFDLILARRY